MERWTTRLPPTPRVAAVWLLGALTLPFLAPVPASLGEAADTAERDPQSELILLASGSIAGNLEPCG